MAVSSHDLSDLNVTRAPCEEVIGQVHPVAGTKAGQQLIQPREVGRPVDVDPYQVADRPCPSARTSGVDSGGEVATFRRGEQPGGGSIRPGHHRSSRPCFDQCRSRSRSSARSSASTLARISRSSWPAGTSTT